MIKEHYPVGDTLEEVFDSLHINPAYGMSIVQSLIREGYTCKGICYAIGKSYEKLLRFREDSRFAGVFKNEVRKYAFNQRKPKE